MAEMEGTASVRSPGNENSESVRSPGRENSESVRSPGNEKSESVWSLGSENSERVRSPGSPGNESPKSVRSPGIKKSESVRRSGSENSEKAGRSCRDDEDICSKGNLSSEEKGECRPPYERHRNSEFHRTPECSPKRQAHSRHSDELKYSRQKQPWKSPKGSPRHHKENGHLEKKMKESSHPEGERGREKHWHTKEGHRHRGGSGPTKLGHQERRSQPRSQWRATDRGRSKDLPMAWHSCPERLRPGSSGPGASSKLSLLSGLLTQADALAVALGELQAPGGAFLQVPAQGTHPTASQRAWLCWQLSHAGSALQGALHNVHSMLAAQPWPPGSPVEPAHLFWRPPS